MFASAATGGDESTTPPPSIEPLEPGTPEEVVPEEGAPLVAPAVAAAPVEACPEVGAPLLGLTIAPLPDELPVEAMFPLDPCPEPAAGVELEEQAAPAKETTDTSAARVLRFVRLIKRLSPSRLPHDRKACSTPSKLRRFAALHLRANQPSSRALSTARVRSRTPSFESTLEV